MSKLKLAEMQDNFNLLKGMYGNDLGGTILKGDIKRIYSRGGLWGDALIIYEFECLLSGSRSGDATICVVLLPDHEPFVVVGHHEGTNTESLAGFMSREEEFLAEYEERLDKIKQLSEENWTMTIPIKDATEEDHENCNIAHKFNASTNYLYLIYLVERLVRKCKNDREFIYSEVVTLDMIDR